jgi:hypothetical protein
MDSIPPSHWCTRRCLPAAEADDVESKLNERRNSMYIGGGLLTIVLILVVLFVLL